MATFEETPTTENIIAYARKYANEQYTPAVGQVLKAAFFAGVDLPSLRLRKQVTLEEYVCRWVGAYLNALNNRPSVRKGNASGTHPDPIVKLILVTLLPMDNATAAGVIDGHATMMTIENLAGELLEEYLSEKLLPLGWYCCWGSTVSAVDFCNKDGRLLQVKNSDNSENSSSSKIRVGTKIEKWYRRKSTMNEAFNWEELNKLAGDCDVSEENFRKFVKETIERNPASVFISETHSLKAKK